MTAVCALALSSSGGPLGHAGPARPPQEPGCAPPGEKPAPGGPGAGVPGGGGANRGTNAREDETKNYEITKTVTHTITRGSRLKKLSVAVLLDTPVGKSRPEDELKRLEALAKSAVGVDAARGDQFQISASVFSHPVEPPEAKLSFLDSPRIRRIAQLVGGVILLIIAALAISKMRGLASSASASSMGMLRPGARVGEWWL